jgi:hypothetical protein
MDIAGNAHRQVGIIIFWFCWKLGIILRQEALLAPVRFDRGKAV